MMIARRRAAPPRLARAHTRRRASCWSCWSSCSPRSSDGFLDAANLANIGAVDDPAAARAADDADHHDRGARPVDGRGAHARLVVLRHDGQWRPARRRSASPPRSAIGLAFGSPTARWSRCLEHPAVRRHARHARHRAGALAGRHRRAERRRHAAQRSQHVYSGTLARHSGPDRASPPWPMRCSTACSTTRASAPTSSRSAATARRCGSRASPDRLMLIAVYALGGAMAGLAALLLTARMNAAHPTAASASSSTRSPPWRSAAPRSSAATAGCSARCSACCRSACCATASTCWPCRRRCRSPASACW